MSRGCDSTFFEEVHLSLACARIQVKVRKESTEELDAGQPMFHVWRLFADSGLSSSKQNLIPHVRGHTIAWSHRTS